MGRLIPHDAGVHGESTTDCANAFAATPVSGRYGAVSSAAKPGLAGTARQNVRLAILAPLCALAQFVSTVAVAQPELDRLRQSLIARLPVAAFGELAPTPVPGLYQMAVQGQVVYVSADGRYLLSGRLIDLDTGTDLTERVLGLQRSRLLAEVPEEQMIVFEPTGATRHTLTTFTDIDCPYCRKMHSEIDRLNRMGIRVRYMLFPRAGSPSVSYDKAVSVWCAPDQRTEMTLAKRGVMPQKRDCPNPVEEHMAVANQLGLQGTPYSVTDTGRVIGGYLPADALLESLDADKREHGG